MINKLSDDKSSTPNSEYGNMRLEMSIASIIMVPLAILFLNANSRIGLLFLFGSPVLAIYVLVYLKSISKNLLSFSEEQLNKHKKSKIICIVSLVISLLTISFAILQLMSDSF